MMRGPSLLLGILALISSVEAQGDLPQLKLPWGTWEAQVHDHDPNIYIFKNVRFGANPVRFSAPSFPDWKNDSIQTSDKSISCVQVNASLDPGDKDGSEVLQTEDCLFLDVYAPVSAFRDDAETLPVVVWVYGGGYVVGSKYQGGPANTGQSILKASGYKTVFVSGNYRLGAFGWLAGNYLEGVGTPNAGLYDQTLVLEWVQHYINQVNGDKEHVSAWGFSAGGGSVLHHLIREGGTRDPLFKSFATLSPEFHWAWDNSPDGQLDGAYKLFSASAGCESSYDIDCLRSKPGKDLIKANDDFLFSSVLTTGILPVGPAIDGKWIKTLPPLAFSQGDYWKDIKSGIVSHVTNESFGLTPNLPSNSESSFDLFLATLFAGDALKPQRQAIKDKYDCKDAFEGDWQACIAALTRDVSFACNTRNLIDSYASKTHAMQYAFPNELLAYHGSDQIPLFSNNFDEVKTQLVAQLNSSIGESLAGALAVNLTDTVLPIFQNFYASFALSGDPNTLPSDPHVEWPLANSDGEEVSNVLKVTLGDSVGDIFQIINDDLNKKDICSFWGEIAKAAVAQEGGACP